MTTQEGSEAFHIKLIRDGDEESIVENIDLANLSLENAKAVSDAWVADNRTASFTYYNPVIRVVQRGLDRLEEALPYLYATCDKLGRVRIERFGEAICFEPSGLYKYGRDDFVINNTDISITTDDGVTSLTAVRTSRKDRRSALLAVLENGEADTQRVRFPSEGFARVFVTFPIAGTDLLPFNVVLDANFAPLQERDGIAMHDADKSLLEEALSVLPTLVQHTVESGYLDAHNLALLAVPDSPLSGETESGELAWWEATVLRVAEETAAMSIVQTESGLLPVLHDQSGPAVSFFVPAINADATQSVDYDTAYEIANAITDLNLPSKEVAQSWGEIARRWADIGVSVERLGLDELTVWLKERADSIDELPVQGRPFSWLARLFLLAADMNDQNVRDMVDGLLPDQYGKFHGKGDILYTDPGIPTEIKDIAASIGEDLRERLLHNAMADALAKPGYETANDLVWQLHNGDYTETDAIDEILDTLEERLPDNSQFDEADGFDTLLASARLVSHLAENSDASRIRRSPLLSAEGKIVYLSGNQQILSPKQHWPESAQPYADLYAESRLLSDRYCDDDVLAQALDELITMRLAIAAPLFEGRRAEIGDVNLLREMSSGDHDTSGITVRDASFGQIAFLATDLVQRCGQDAKLAKLLLDFVLNVAVHEDQNWRKVETVAGNRSGDRVALSLYGAIWPFELKVRSWIPVERPDEEGIVPMPANESNLRGILDTSWLRNNRDAQELLHQVFGFQQLNLALDTLDDETKKDLTELLQNPELVTAAAANPDAVKFASELDSANVSLDTVRGIVQEMEEQRRKVQGIQDFGFSVESLVRESLELAGFSVRRTGIGSDFEIAMELGDVTNLELTKSGQSWLVEVKATREQKVVRMSDTQARTAAKENERFLLCVVPVDSESEDPELDDVLADMRFVADMGSRVTSLCDDLGDFEERRDEITADELSGVQLEITSGPARVRVARSVWENDGFPLDELSERLSSQ